jgi:hypothetical protein
MNPGVQARAELMWQYLLISGRNAPKLSASILEFQAAMMPHKVCFQSRQIGWSFLSFCRLSGDFPLVWLKHTKGQNNGNPGCRRGHLLE